MSLKTAFVLAWLASSAHAATTALVLAQSAEARDAAQDVSAQLGRQGIGAQVTGAGRACGDLEGKPHLECLADVAQTAWVDAVVVVSVAGTKDKGAVVLEAVGRKSRKLLLEASVSGSAEELDLLVKDAVMKISAAIKASVRATAAPAAAVAPKPSAPAPAPSPHAPEVDAAFAAQDPALVPKPVAEAPAPTVPALADPPPPAKKTNVAAWTATGATLVSLGVAVAFGAMTVSERAQLTAANPITRISPYSYEQARQLRDASNLHMGVAIGTAVLGAAGLGVSIALW